ncbi:MAG: MAPEG family protein [Alphaproteobacteria bacterium]|jgi:uncharacterized MAPEG superfamily protein|nr:MAPEG family protein [Alphaproteobacteria bacterium]MDP6515780.1 MAPEG family protein [Alphaproteobacteria bacterium]|tara:strand:- start:150 stop:542 length:393 start_codon:yes stop_codon:yes gene_type:complete
MTYDLYMLALASGLAAVMWIPYIVSRVQTWGMVDALGYPEEQPDLPLWAQRAHRAHLNLLENLPHFAALVLIAHVAGVANTATAFGAALFFWARVLQAIVTVAKVPYVRTAAFAAGFVGEVVIFFQIIRL